MTERIPRIAAPAESANRLSPCCHCGKIVSAPCPTLADMPAAHLMIEAQGWVWRDGVGHSCSEECADAAGQAAEVRHGRAPPAKAATATASDARRLPLFGEAS